MDTSHARAFKLADSDYTEEEDVKPIIKSYGRSRVGTKASGACVHCKSLKVRCEFGAGASACQRCIAGGYECMSRTRKKRKPAPTHEELIQRAQDQDMEIQGLLLQFDRIREDGRIREWMTGPQPDLRHSLSHSTGLTPFEARSRRPRWVPTGDEGAAEMACLSYFAHGGTNNIHRAPDVVRYCELYPQDVKELFHVFFERINPYFSILDPELHTPGNLIWTCPFLFTVICGLACRYDDSRRHIYELAMTFARTAAGKALVDGFKSVDACQAYLLLGTYPMPKRNFADDRSWMFLGVAVRMAQELGLDRPSSPELPMREQLNRTRVWLHCYCVDGAHAVQLGKPAMITPADFLARTSTTWYQTSPLNTPFDIHLCGYVGSILRLRQWQIAKKDDTLASICEHTDRMAREMYSWQQIYEQQLTLNRKFFVPFQMVSYLRLTLLAAGLRQSMKKGGPGLTRDCEIFKKAYDAAKTVIETLLDDLYYTGLLRYAVEDQFLYVAYAAAFLVNLLRPKFRSLLDDGQQRHIASLVNRLIDVLGSKDVALDERHTPALYSRFLENLLEKRHLRSSENDRSSRSGSDSPKGTMYAQRGEERLHTPPNHYIWPDVGHNMSPASSLSSSGGDVSPSPSAVYRQSGDPDMDFSMNHFLRTVTQQPVAQFAPELPATTGMAWSSDWALSDSQAATSWSYGAAVQAWK
ncbi:fungal-specific transcription factor domain-containing protein [Schizophyllum amplum]|uniref:Fungal-specific transcription factor domain-containing protein n=1 Tax=Schizophyllum amplum TaxID=97359 RepID=A0A550BYC5_9AGAR|nr:fungal-specific transcription factor domain-containing protein [Auriculariopsis ampla]